MRDESRTGVSEELYQQGANFFIRNPDRWIRRSELQKVLGIGKTQTCRLIQILSSRLALEEKEQKSSNSPLLLRLSSKNIRKATEELSSISSLTEDDRRMLSVLMDMAESTSLYGDMISNLKKHLAMSRFLKKGVIPVYSYSPEMQLAEESVKLLPVVLQAISESREVWVTYKSPWADEKRYTISPIGLFTQNGILYLYSYSAYYRNSMAHAFSRIKDISLAEETKIPEEFKDIAQIIDPFGIVVDDEITEVEVWISPAQAFFEKESLKNDNAEITDNEDGSIIIRIGTRNLYACKRWILGLGRQAECLGPEDLVEDIITELNSTIDKYHLPKTSRNL